MQSQAGFDIRDLSAIREVPRCRLPALFVCAKMDDFIGTHHTQALHDAYGGPKEIIVAEGDHNTLRSAKSLLAIGSFLKKELAPDSARDAGEAVDAFARDAEAHLVTIRARIERSGLESSIGLRASRREKTPRRLVEVIEDDDADAVVRDATASSESCAVLLACAAHGALRDGDAPSWSSRRASGAAAETYDAGSRSVSFTVVCFEETCEILFEALVSPKNAFGDEADEDEAAARVASRQLLWCLQRRELMDEDSARVVSTCLLYTSPSPRDLSTSRMPSSA